MKEFRFLNKFEYNIIKKTLNKFEKNMLKEIENNQYTFLVALFLNKKEYPEVYCISNDLIKFYKRVSNKTSKNIISVGTYFGYLKRGKLILSIESIDFLNELGLIPENKTIILTDKGEKSALYGNNILKKDILKINGPFYEGDFLISLNQKKEVISLVKSQISRSKMKSNKNRTIFLNLIDKGYYLREQ